MSVTSPADYKGKVREQVKLPSGAVFEIRGIPPELLPDILIPGAMPATPEEYGKLSAEEKATVSRRLIGIMKTIFPVCVVRPRIVVGSIEEESSVNFNDILFDDSIELLNAIFRKGGLSPEAREEREKFREKPAGPASS